MAEPAKPWWEALTPSVVAGWLGGVATLLGILKTLTGEATGSSISAGDVTFYIGITVIAVYLALGAAVMVVGIGVAMIGGALGLQDTETFPNALVGLILIAAAWLLYEILFASDTAEATTYDTTGRILARLVGFAALSATVIYAASKKSASS